MNDHCTSRDGRNGHVLGKRRERLSGAVASHRHRKKNKYTFNSKIWLPSYACRCTASNVTMWTSVSSDAAGSSQVCYNKKRAPACTLWAWHRCDYENLNEIQTVCTIAKPSRDGAGSAGDSWLKMELAR